MIGENTPAFVMTKPRKSLMHTSPERPGQVIGKRERQPGYETKEKPSDFGNAQGNHDGEIGKHVGLNRIDCCWLWHLGRLLRLFLGASPSPLARKAAKK